MKFHSMFIVLMNDAEYYQFEEIFPSRVTCIVLVLSLFFVQHCLSCKSIGQLKFQIV